MLPPGSPASRTLCARRVLPPWYSRPMVTRRLFLAILLALGALGPAEAQAPATVTFLHFNDVYEIGPVEGGRAGGLARVAMLRARLRRTAAPLVTTLGGDYLSPSALGTARVDGERLAGRQMVAVLNTLGLEWATYGNHEFDVPEATFRARLAESTFRIVSSNVTDAAGQPFPGTVTHTVLALRSGGRTVRIGLIGLTLAANPVPWVRYAPPIEAATRAVEALRGRCDAIVALTHLALAGDQQLVEQVPEIDLVLGGHEHENWLLRRGPRLTPIVKADANVRTVAIVTMRFGRRGTRPAVSARLEAITDRIQEGPRTAAVVKKWTDAGFNGFRQEGFDPAQVIATSTTALDGREAAVRNGGTTLTGLIGAALQHEAAPVEAAVYNSGSIRIDDVLPPGPVTQYDVIRVLPFGGTILRATVTGALLQRVLAVGDENRGTGGYLQWTGVTRDASGVQIAGQPLDPARRYTIATSDFLLSGREANLGFFKTDNPEVSGVTELRDIRLAVIAELTRQFPRK